MKRRWSDLAALPVLLGEDSRELGRLRGVFINPETGQLIGFLVGFSRVLASTDIERWGDEAVYARGKDSLVSPFEILRIEKFGLRRTLFLSKKVLSKKGRRFGKLRDFTLDTGLDILASIECSKGFFGFKWGHRIFSRSEITEILDGKIVVQVEPEEKEGTREHVQVPAAV
ncbi:MAG: hypothetical protein AAB802_02500 [Patescibacteria group bacterium]